MGEAKSPPTQLKVVILDFPKITMKNEIGRRVFAEVAGVRQESFRRTLDSYLALDRHDMIGTHVLIFETSQLFSPRLLSGIRLTYKSRSQNFGLKLPLEENIIYASKETQDYFRSYMDAHSEVAECNGWFVDPDFSFSATKIDLAQILFFSLCTFLMRQNQYVFIGAPNERYKATRWVEKVGPFTKGHFFTHPAVPDPHQLTLVERFYPQWLRDCALKYETLINHQFEILPDSSGLRSVEDVFAEILNSPAPLKKVA